VDHIIVVIIIVIAIVVITGVVVVITGVVVVIAVVIFPLSEPGFGDGLSLRDGLRGDLPNPIPNLPTPFAIRR